MSEFMASPRNAKEPGGSPDDEAHRNVKKADGVLLGQSVKHIFKAGLALEDVRANHVHPEAATYIQLAVDELDEALRKIGLVAFQPE